MVGAEEEDKNWKGIIISLLVIAFILAMIVTAIALITKGKSLVAAALKLSYTDMFVCLLPPISSL